ncbi:MAG TPA: DegT/DnrJ/EryC1/StrS family aminotransferase [Pyrinomonadaceae bacterium]|nr:DegT/DnrJ/EryC1/StrS family aminotransferase [Pyrinomonadaceae bacterium]
MTTALMQEEKLMTLPSDQDSSGRTFGEAELMYVAEVLESGTLTTTKGKFGRALEQKFAEAFGVKYAYACTSGSAAIHIAVATINPNPGDEIITTSITDMGALAPLMYRGVVPVFAEVDTKTLNVTAKTIEARISERTKAIIVTHLFGNPCEMDDIMALAKKHNLPVIEDSAQTFLANYGDKMAGTIGDIGCFSLQQGKHMTTGEGGMVVTNDEKLARHMFLYINKAWGYGDKNPDHYFMALNYRISELQAAVALGQLEKLQDCVDNRARTAARLTEMLKGIDGIETPVIADKAKHVYWKYCLTVDDAKIEGGSPGMAALLKEKNIFSAPRYIVKPAFMCQVFQEKNTLGDSQFPFNLARPEAIDYQMENYPDTAKALHDVLVLPWNEKYTDEHVEYIADNVRAVVEALRK